HRKTETWRGRWRERGTGERIARRGAFPVGTDETEVEDRVRTRRVPDAKGDCGTGVRANQRATTIPALQLPRAGEGACRMEADLPHAQPAEAVPLRLADS